MKKSGKITIKYSDWIKATTREGLDQFKRQLLLDAGAPIIKSKVYGGYHLAEDNSYSFAEKVDKDFTNVVCCWWPK